MNVPQFGIIGIALVFTVIYFLYDCRNEVGAMAFGSWFFSAMITIGYNHDAWAEATFFAMMAVVMVVLMIMQGAEDVFGSKHVDHWADGR